MKKSYALLKATKQAVAEGNAEKPEYINTFMTSREC
jgi:hypothetical protein